MTELQSKFIDNIANACIKLYDKYKILPSMTIAQAIKESRWGQSSLSSKYYNFFGMKWTSKCGCEYVELPTKEWNGNKYITINAKFRKYNSFEEGIEGYYKFITGYNRYNNLIGEKDSYTACIKIQLDGWATAPDYGVSLYNDYVSKYDLIKYDDVVLNHIELPKIETPKDELVYVVKKGDTLWGISQKFLGSGIKWRKIAYANNLTGSLIKIGQVLKIPKGE